MIVPNSNLISNEVVNWTLSSVRRRVDIRVGVAHGTEPERVFSLLIEVAAAHSGVARNPKPEAYFVGVGDSALNFELRFWTYQEDWFRLRGEERYPSMTADLRFEEKDAVLKPHDKPNRIFGSHWESGEP